MTGMGSFAIRHPWMTFILVTMGIGAIAEVGVAATLKAPTSPPTPAPGTTPPGASPATATPGTNPATGTF
jgi:hypothetical protein